MSETHASDEAYAAASAHFHARIWLRPYDHDRGDECIQSTGCAVSASCRHPVVIWPLRAQIWRDAWVARRLRNPGRRWCARRRDSSRCARISGGLRRPDWPHRHAAPAVLHKVPRSTIRPDCSTKIRSAWRTVDSRCAIVIVVSSSTGRSRLGSALARFEHRASLWSLIRFRRIGLCVRSRRRDICHLFTVRAARRLYAYVEDYREPGGRPVGHVPANPRQAKYRHRAQPVQDTEGRWVAFDHVSGRALGFR